MKITKEQAVIMLKKMPEMANEIYLDYPELKPLKVADSWEQLGKIDGYYIEEVSCISKTSFSIITNFINKNIFKTEKQAASVLAYAQLTQLMADCGDCEIDWRNSESKYCVIRSMNDLKTSIVYYNFNLLTFNTPEIAKEFMEKHEGLIKQFYQL
jgi:hypothetical protein